MSCRFSRGRVQLGLLAWGLLFAGIVSPVWADISSAQEPQAGLGFKMLSHPSWPVERHANSIVFQVDETAGDRVTATISRSPERPLEFDDLTPSALQYVYGYEDHFFYAKIRMAEQPVVYIEAHPAGKPDEYLQDYFLLHDRYLYRVSFYAQSAGNYSRYQPLFLKMINSFRFVIPPAPELEDVADERFFPGETASGD